MYLMLLISLEMAFYSNNFWMIMGVFLHMHAHHHLMSFFDNPILKDKDVKKRALSDMKTLYGL